MLRPRVAESDDDREPVCLPWWSPEKDRAAPEGGPHPPAEAGYFFASLPFASAGLAAPQAPLQERRNRASRSRSPRPPEAFDFLGTSVVDGNHRRVAAVVSSGISTPSGHHEIRKVDHLVHLDARQVDVDEFRQVLRQAAHLDVVAQVRNDAPP